MFAILLLLIFSCEYTSWGVEALCMNPDIKTDWFLLWRSNKQYMYPLYKIPLLRHYFN